MTKKLPKVRHIDTTGLPKGFDLADLVESGVVGEELKEWCKSRVRNGPPSLTAEDLQQLRKKKPKKESSRAAPPPPPRSNVVPVSEPEPDPPAEPVALPREFSEDSLADRFTKKHKQSLSYCGSWAAWVHWKGHIWEIDQTGIALDFARRICRDAAADVEERVEIPAAKRKQMANAISSRKTISAVEYIARSDRRTVVLPAMFDADPWALNTPDGLVNLKTGEIRKATRDDLCSKSTAVGPGGQCPAWLSFLEDATKGDHELIRYLQRVAGYCLTGSIAEHKFFFCYGGGGNGKGTFLNQLQWMMNTYARQANMDTFTHQRFSRHAAEIAYFQGARLIVASETSQGSRWNESRIKSMTGGDPITANFMHSNPFTFLPTFKLLFAGNNKPHLAQVDDAMKRRMYLVPFDFDVPRKKLDPMLPEKLQAEGSGILSWCIDGCLDWQRNSLDPPARVIAITNEYFEREDKLQNFIEDSCELGVYYRTSSTALYKRYCAWAESTGEYVGTRRDFLDLMAVKGYKSVKKSGSQMFEGIRPVEAPAPLWHDD